MGAAAPAIALAMSVAGQVTQGVEANRAARAGARADEENGRRAVLLGEQETLETRRDERRITGDLIAAMAGSGLGMDSASFGDLIADNAYQREREILNLRTRRAQEANNLYGQAKERRKAGRAALIGSLFSAVGTAIGGAQQLKSQAAVRGQIEAERGAALAPAPAMRVRG
jgi:hypothetical protein